MNARQSDVDGNSHENAASTWFTYDDANRLTNRLDQLIGRTYNTHYDYDGNDRLTQITYPSGRLVNYAYDANGHGTAVTRPDGIVYADVVSGGRVTHTTPWVTA